jgi:hypothetical protein
MYWGHLNSFPLVAREPDSVDEATELLRLELEKRGVRTYEYVKGGNVGLVEIFQGTKLFNVVLREYTQTSDGERGECVRSETEILHLFNDVMSYLKDNDISLDGFSL